MDLVAAMVLERLEREHLRLLWKSPASARRCSRVLDGSR